MTKVRVTAQFTLSIYQAQAQAQHCQTSYLISQECWGNHWLENNSDNVNTLVMGMVRLLNTVNIKVAISNTIQFVNVVMLKTHS